MRRDLPAVLLAEDEEHDVFFMRRAFEFAGIENPLVALENGQELIQYLESQEGGSRSAGPSLLLLDLKMPLVDGFEVLSWLQHQPRWRDRLPALVISSSGEERDKRKAFELGAHEYLVKPGSFKDLITLAQDLKQRWLDIHRPVKVSPRRRRAQHR